MRVLIVDDEPLARKRLAHGLARFDTVECVGEASCGKVALEMITAHAPDVVLLDIRMPEGDGFDVAEAVATHPDPPSVVFVTAFDSYAVRAFECNASDYLLKPVEFERLRDALDRARHRRAMRAALDRSAELTDLVSQLRAEHRDIERRMRGFDFWVPHVSGTERVPIETVLWLSAERDYVRVHTTRQSHLVRGKIGEQMDRLPPDEFMRVHRSAIVRVSAITAIERSYAGGPILRLSNEDHVRVGGSHRRTVLERLEKDGRIARSDPAGEV